MKKVFVAIPTGGTIRTELLFFLLNLDRDYDTKISATTFGSCAENRNKLVTDFLKTDFEWLLLLDADTIPPSDILNMTENNVDVCSGLYYVWIKNGLHPLAMNKVDNSYQVSKETGLFEVDGIGGGTLLIRREILEKIDPPYFLVTHDSDGLVEQGNDLYFCEKVKKAGFKIWVDTSYRSDHYKTVNLKLLGGKL